jgi:hypothetical protein
VNGKKEEDISHFGLFKKKKRNKKKEEIIYLTMTVISI